MLLTERLRKEKFPATQQAVVDYILKNPEAIRDMTIREIAKATYTSNATMIRIAQKLHYPGWEPFKEDFLQEQDYLALSFSNVDPNIPFGRDDSLMSIAMKTAELEMEAISDTLQLLDEQQFRRAADLLFQAQLINVLGINNTYCLAELFALKLGRLHKLAFASEPRGELLYNGHLSHPNSCTLIISYSGETAALIRAAQIVRKSGKPLIVITSIGDNALSHLADTVLHICTREKMYSKISWYTSESSISYLLDLLYSALFSMDYDRHLQLRLQTAREIEMGRNSSVAILAEEHPDEDQQQTNL